MLPINNSDTAWLIVADYNQDNDKFHEELREDVLNPDANIWDWEIQTSRIGGVLIGENIGGETGFGDIGGYDDSPSGLVGDDSVPGLAVGGHNASY